MNHDTSALDLIEELRLRRWARSNYVSQENRSADWHPVILNEMQMRDFEEDQHSFPVNQTQAVVPVRDQRILRLDGPHPVGRAARPLSKANNKPAEIYFG